MAGGGACPQGFGKIEAQPKARLIFEHERGSLRLAIDQSAMNELRMLKKRLRHWKKEARALDVPIARGHAQGMRAVLRRERCRDEKLDAFHMAVFCGCHQSLASFAARFAVGNENSDAFDVACGGGPDKRVALGNVRVGKKLPDAFGVAGASSLSKRSRALFLGLGSLGQ